MSKAMRSPTSAVMEFGENTKPPWPTVTWIVFAAAILARPKVPRSERLKSMMAKNNGASGEWEYFVNDDKVADEKLVSFESSSYLCSILWWLAKRYRLSWTLFDATLLFWGCIYERILPHPSVQDPRTTETGNNSGNI